MTECLCPPKIHRGFPDGASGKGSSCQCKRCKSHAFKPWVRKILMSRKWQPTPIFLPGESHGQRSLAGYSPWGHNESDTTEQTLSTKFVVFFFFLAMLCTSEILVSQPGVEHIPSAVEARSPNHWITREFPLNSSGAASHL